MYINITNINSKLSEKINLIMPYGKKRNYKRMAKKSVAKSKANGIKTTKRIVNPALKQMVKRMISGTEEKKLANFDVAYRAPITGSGFNNNLGAGSFGYTTTVTIVPPVAIGTANANRIGNKIVPKSCYIRGVIRALPISAVGGNNAWPNEPFYVRVVIFKTKLNMDLNLNDTILDNGAGSEPFDGTLETLLLPYNKDKYVIGATRQFKLQAPPGTAGTLVNNNIGSLPVSKLFKIRLPMPKVLTYVDTNPDPSNCRWYMAVGTVNVSGNIAANSDIRANITAESIMTYTDA